MHRKDAFFNAMMMSMMLDNGHVHPSFFDDF